MEERHDTAARPDQDASFEQAIRRSRNRKDSAAFHRHEGSARGRNQDRARVAGGQDYEVGYAAKKSGKSASAVKKAVKKVGAIRKKVKKALSR